MARKVDEVKVLNIDNVPYAVDSMSDDVKAMVDVYNDWNQELADAQARLAMVRAALNDLSRNIILKVREEQEQAKAAAAEAEAAAAPAPAPAAPAPAPVAAVQGTTPPVAEEPAAPAVEAAPEVAAPVDGAESA